MPTIVNKFVNSVQLKTFPNALHKSATLSEMSKPLVDASSETSSDMKPQTWANITGSGSESATTTNKPKNSDADVLEKVVKSSIKSVLESEKSKREIIVS